MARQCVSIMPKRANQTNNTKASVCKKAKTCLAIHVDIVEQLERVQELLDRVIDALDALAPIEEEDTEEEGTQEE